LSRPFPCACAPYLHRCLLPRAQARRPSPCVGSTLHRRRARARGLGVRLGESGRGRPPSVCQGGRGTSSCDDSSLVYRRLIIIFPFICTEHDNDTVKLRYTADVLVLATNTETAAQDRTGCGTLIDLLKPSASLPIPSCPSLPFHSCTRRARFTEGIWLQVGVKPKLLFLSARHILLLSFADDNHGLASQW
jgi:hypothetical protein